MSQFFDETMQGLLEAVAISKGEIPLAEKENMPASTFDAADMEKANRWNDYLYWQTRQ